ncbi:MAG: 23S rRNA (uracil(1939)-C(5))-methyltransferase RlmD [Lachnospiraceae bacterium]|nr:23S rRNA (uracil(1939)-C(5))-methyltransferase RlmD [Lachnospiraceae bacterium]
MIKNDCYEVYIEDIGNDGEGIGHIEDRQNGKSFALFVKDTLIGDRALVRIIKVKKTYAYGRVEQIIESSPYRVHPVCEKARSCGGCSLMHMSYDKQLEYKWNKVKSCLERIGGISGVDAIMEPPYGMELPYFYRNKMQLPVGRDREGRIVIGFYAGRTHSIVDLDKCHIGHPVNDYIIKYMRKWFRKFDREDIAYSEESHSGLVRHILTRVGFRTGELMVCLVINKDELGKSEGESLVCLLKEAVKEYNTSKDTEQEIILKSVSININKEKTNRILGSHCKVVWGRSYIQDYIGDILFNISPMSFYQVNPVQTKAIYDKAIEYAELKGGETVWDMYCGIGTISLCLAAYAGKVFGVEVVPQAIEDAKENARVNGIENARFFCGKAEEVVPEFYREADSDEGKHPDVIVVDPPRKGCEKVLLDTISFMAPDRIVYVSCDPATLARDVKILSDKGYRPEKVAVFDAFCQGTHVETVVQLSH